MSPHPTTKYHRRRVETQKTSATELRMYRVYWSPTSPYSRKLLAYLNYKSIFYRLVDTSMHDYLEGDIPARVGVPILPVVVAPDGRTLVDTTATMEWFESRRGEPACIPEQPLLAAAMWIIEEACDAYLIRFAMNYRWGYENSRTAVGHRIARTMLRDRSSRTIRATAGTVIARQRAHDLPLGLDQPGQRKSLDEQLVALLNILEEHFEQRPWLIGGRPSLADFALYGPFYTHLLLDPDSMPILEREAPLTCNWLEMVAQLGDGRGGAGLYHYGDWFGVGNAFPPTLRSLLKWIAGTWQPMAIAELQASAEGVGLFTAQLWRQKVTMATSNYRVWAFRKLQQKLRALNLKGAARVELLDAGLAPILWEGAVVPATEFDELNLPLVDNPARFAKAWKSG